MKKFNLIIVCIFILAVLLRVFLICQKDDLFVDEIFNMTYSNHNELIKEKQSYVELNKIYNGKEIKKRFLLDNSSFKDTVNDVKALHKGTGDVLHTNFYYTIFRFVFNGVDEYNFNVYLFRAFLINIILFSFSFFFIFKLLNILFNNKLYTSIGLFIAYINPVAVSNTIFLREYQLQELLFVLISYLLILYYKKLKLNNICKKDYFIFSFVTALTSLSGYYAGFFAFCIFLIMFILYPSKKTAKFLGVCGLFSFILLLIMYPTYFSFFTSAFVHSTAQSSFISEPLTHKTVSNSHGFGVFLIKLIQYPLTILHYTCSYLLFLFFIWLVFKKEKNNTNFNSSLKKGLISISCLTVLWLEVVLATCPYKVVRYILPIIPLFTLYLTYILSRVKIKYVGIAICLLCLHSSFVFYNTFHNAGKIYFTNIRLTRFYPVSMKDSKNPIYIYTSTYRDKMSALSAHLLDTQQYIFIDKNYNITDKHFKLITDDKNILNNKNIINLQKTYWDYVTVEIEQ